MKIHIILNTQQDYGFFYISMMYVLYWMGATAF